METEVRWKTLLRYKCQWSLFSSSCRPTKQSLVCFTKISSVMLTEILMYYSIYQCDRWKFAVPSRLLTNASNLSKSEWNTTWYKMDCEWCLEIVGPKNCQEQLQKPSQVQEWASLLPGRHYDGLWHLDPRQSIEIIYKMDFIYWFC